MDENAQGGATTERAEREIIDRFLKHLAENGDSEVLRELGSEILRGNISLADGVAFTTYADALKPKMIEFSKWYQSLTEDERQKEAAACTAEVEKLEVKLAAADNAQRFHQDPLDQSASAAGWRLNRRAQ